MCDTMDTHIKEKGDILSWAQVFFFYDWQIFLKSGFLSGIHSENRD